MHVCVLAGGVGSARFLTGLVRVLDPADVTVVVNTGDDEAIRGLHVSPDIDTVLYHLAGLTDWDRGWGLQGETFVTNDAYRELAARADESIDLQEWFALGDRDLATHLLRTRVLEAGCSLSEATDVLRRALGVQARVVPMSDDTVRTLVTTSSGEELDFQTYFVRRQHSEEIVEVSYDGITRAAPAPGVVDAISGAEIVIIPPSNPLLSIAPILGMAAVRTALEASNGIRVAISPIVGGRAIKGPADNLLTSLGHEASATGVARIYAGLVDTFVLDDEDEPLSSSIDDLGMRALVTDTMMRTSDHAARLAKEVIAHAGR